MGIKNKIKNIINKIGRIVRYEVKTPTYIPVVSSDILKDKTILVTGGNSGIGYAIANACLRSGGEVIISGRNEDKLFEAKKKLIHEVGCDKDRIITFVLDVQKVGEIKNKLEQIIESTCNKKIDILVNNAGVAVGWAIGRTKEEDFDMTIAINLKGSYFMAQEFSNYLIEKGIKGNILNISSASGVRPAITPYMLSKWGLTGLTEGLAKKCIQYNIVVNGIAPGPTATDMICLDGKNLMYEKSPAKRYVDPVEVANLAVFLISDMGRMIVGDTVYITGGCGTLTVDDIKY